MLIYSCEKADQTTTSPVANNEQLAARWITPTGCESCTGHDDCCCGIELQNPLTDDAYISICGSHDGGGTCSYSMLPSPCTDISGGGQTTYLNMSHPKDGFCMIPGSSFAITNYHGSQYAYVKITCHWDIVNPTYTYLTIPPNTTYFFYVNGDCDISRCSQ